MLEDNLTNNLTQTEFSVSEISGKIKWLLENKLGIVKMVVKFRLKKAASGHGYFSLKDDNAVPATF